jgi:hypothetical protein
LNALCPGEDVEQAASGGQGAADVARRYHAHAGALGQGYGEAALGLEPPLPVTRDIQPGALGPEDSEGPVQLVTGEGTRAASSAQALEQVQDWPAASTWR